MILEHRRTFIELLQEAGQVMRMNHTATIVEILNNFADRGTLSSLGNHHHRKYVKQRVAFCYLEVLVDVEEEVI